MCLIGLSLNEKWRIFLEIFLVNYFSIYLSRSVIFSDKWARYSFTIGQLGQDLAELSVISSPVFTITVWVGKIRKINVGQFWGLNEQIDFWERKNYERYYEIFSNVYLSIYCFLQNMQRRLCRVLVPDMYLVVCGLCGGVVWWCHYVLSVQPPSSNWVSVVARGERDTGRH